MGLLLTVPSYVLVHVTYVSEFLLEKCDERGSDPDGCSTTEKADFIMSTPLRWIDIRVSSPQIALGL